MKATTMGELLKLKNPDASKITINKKRGTCTLGFLATPYEIDLDRIKTEAHLLAWVRHLASKPWMNGQRIKLFITKVAKAKGFVVKL